MWGDLWGTIRNSQTRENVMVPFGERDGSHSLVRKNLTSVCTLRTCATPKPVRSTRQFEQPVLSALQGKEDVAGPDWYVLYTRDLCYSVGCLCQKAL